MESSSSTTQSIIPGHSTNSGKFKGLSDAEVIDRRKLSGLNKTDSGKSRGFLRSLRSFFADPMVFLLLIACVLYFLLGSIAEGTMTLVAIALVTGISFYQENRSARAMEALKQFTTPRTMVIRNGIPVSIGLEELVPGDLVILEEGNRVPADARIVESTDLSVDESVITGESLPVTKEVSGENGLLYQGSMVNSGQCVAEVIATGNQTMLGKIGKSIDQVAGSGTVLQGKVSRFVRKFAVFGLVAFFAILLVNYLHYGDFVTSLLFALALAMSVIPEEIPVAFSSFMALGAYRMSKLGILCRQPQVIENLGAVSVLCLDKTGTITQNRMSVKKIYDQGSGRVSGPEGQEGDTLLYAALASEVNPFDPMEKALLEALKQDENRALYSSLEMIFGYPLGGKPPMMTHVYSGGEQLTIAAKGAVERIARVCGLSDAEKEKVIGYTKEFAGQGYRVLGVAGASYDKKESLPEDQDSFAWQFKGLVALYDPPRENAEKVLADIQDSGIRVKLVTGDFPETASSIAGQVGIRDAGELLTGEQVISMEEETLRKAAGNVNVFARMFPDAKLKLVNALKEKGEMVAMTGDGVNDGPALKAADIGIAMGQGGTEIARRAADLVITDDNLESIVTAVAQGKRIYINLVKGIRYIISIHIPIILIASLPVILQWKYINIFSPLHIIFLELIMGPTCSVFFERETVHPGELAKRRYLNKSLFTRSELWITIVQGIVISLVILGLYYYYMEGGYSIGVTRNMVFTTLVLCNILLTFSNRSYSQPIWQTISYPNSLVPLVLGVPLVFLLLFHLHTGVSTLFDLESISAPQLGFCALAAIFSLLWFEIYKAMGKHKEPRM